MNWTMALWGLGAIAFFGLTVTGLEQALPPLLAYAVSTVAYLAVLAVAIFQGTTDEDRHVLIGYTKPSTGLTVLAALPVIGMAIIAMVLNDVLIPVPLYLFIAIGALCHGLATEFFWRGALIPAPTKGDVMLAFVLGTASYLPLVLVGGLSIFGGPFAAVIGGAILTAIALALRLRTGALGAGIAMQIGTQLFVLTDLTARNFALS